MPEFLHDGETLRYEVHGEGPPIVTVANLAQPQGFWPGPMVPLLTDAGYSVVTYHHLGPDRVTAAGVAADTSALVEHLRLPPVLLWGYSQGGVIAQELVISRPDLVSGAVLMGTLGRVPRFAATVYAAQRSLIGREAEFPEVNAVLMSFSMFPLEPTVLADDTVVAPMLEMFQAAAGGGFDVQAMTRSLTLMANYETRLDALSGVTVPCLVISFELDGNVFAILGREVANAIPGCRYEEIKGASHTGYVIAQDSVMRAVLDFFKSVNATAPAT